MYRDSLEEGAGGAAETDHYSLCAFKSTNPLLVPN